VRIHAAKERLEVLPGSRPAQDLFQEPSCGCQLEGRAAESSRQQQAAAALAAGPAGRSVQLQCSLVAAGSLTRLASLQRNGGRAEFRASLLRVRTR